MYAECKYTWTFQRIPYTAGKKTKNLEKPRYSQTISIWNVEIGCIQFNEGYWTGPLAIAINLVGRLVGWLVRSRGKLLVFYNPRKCSLIMSSLERVEGWYLVNCVESLGNFWRLDCSDQLTKAKAALSADHRNIANNSWLAEAGLPSFCNIFWQNLIKG